MIVYVVGYEPIPFSASVGGFDWFYKKEDRDKHYEDEIMKQKFHQSHTIYKGEVEIDEYKNKISELEAEIEKLNTN